MHRDGEMEMLVRLPNPSLEMWCILELLRRKRPYMAALSSSVAAVPASAKTNTIMLAVTFLTQILQLKEIFVCVSLSKMASLVGKGARQWPGVAVLEAVIIQRPAEP